MQPLSHLNLVDTHCHLDFDVFKDEHIKVLEDAKHSGVHTIIIPGVDIASSQEAVKMANRYDNLFAAVGVHPNEALSWDAETEKILETLAVNRKVVAIGEIGLDYYRNSSPRAIQNKILEKQLELAMKLKLPVILHNRDASQDMLSVLESWCSSLVSLESPLVAQPGVFHSFSSDYDTAIRCINRNFYLGITGPITFPNARDLREIISQISLENLLLETDAPFLAPQPRRGKRNEPAFLIYIAQKISELKNETIEKVARITTANARRLFQIGEKTLA